MNQYYALTTVVFPNETSEDAVLFFSAPDAETAGAMIGDEQERHRYRHRYPLDARYGVWRGGAIEEPEAVSHTVWQLDHDGRGTTLHASAEHARAWAERHEPGGGTYWRWDDGNYWFKRSGETIATIRPVEVLGSAETPAPEELWECCADAGIDCPSCLTGRHAECPDCARYDPPDEDDDA